MRRRYARGNVCIAIAGLVALFAAQASGNVISDTGVSDDSVSLHMPVGGFILTSPAALSHAAFIDLINETPVLETLQPPASPNDREDCAFTSGALFHKCFGSYSFIPQVSIASGEFYWLLETKPSLRSNSGSASGVAPQL
jgi:hypothetical protein